MGAGQHEGPRQSGLSFFLTGLQQGTRAWCITAEASKKYEAQGAAAFHGPWAPGMAGTACSTFIQAPRERGTQTAGSSRSLCCSGCTDPGVTPTCPLLSEKVDPVSARAEPAREPNHQAPGLCLSHCRAEVCLDSPRHPALLQTPLPPWPGAGQRKALTCRALSCPVFSSVTEDSPSRPGAAPPAQVSTASPPPSFIWAGHWGPPDQSHAQPTQSTWSWPLMRMGQLRSTEGWAGGPPCRTIHTWPRRASQL